MFQASRGSGARGPAVALARVHVAQDRIARGLSKKSNKAVVRPHVIIKSCLPLF